MTVISRRTEIVTELVVCRPLESVTTTVYSIVLIGVATGAATLVWSRPVIGVQP